MKKLFFLFIAIGNQLLVVGQTNNIANSRSDTVDILHYQINLNITDFTKQRISGSCDITFTPKLNGVSSINLDLLKLNIDSITASNKALTYSYNDTLIKITLPKTLNIKDTFLLHVYYNGSPQKDKSGFGGFYFDATYAYNIGVGFDAQPHTYGRVWFPCVDNFVERSSYEFNIITAGGRKATCNGALINEQIIAADTIVRKWRMNEPIQSYLASVAVSDYETVHLTHQGLNANIPIELVARTVDTTNVKKSFIHLGNAINTFEKSYGPYQWNKIGYSCTSFAVGAMEHATNIIYPQSFADGTLDEENIMAHELAHHWWGDLVTCETAEDMWINEGMATYSEHLFLEKTYNYNTSLTTIKNNHQYVLQFAHIADGGYRAIANMPQQYTYGRHVYLKGGSVIHNMRAYMGDSLFFVGLQSILKKYSFKNMNTYQYRDELKNATGLDMTNFFNDWIFAPGFSHFSIDSTQIKPKGTTFDVTVYIQQKLKGATNYHIATPIELSFYDKNWKKYTQTITASGQYTIIQLNLPFNPVLSLINENNKLNQARTDNQLIIKAPSVIDLNLSLSKLWVSAITDSALIQIEHHWVAPDTIKNNPYNYQISNSRYWTIEGILPTNFVASAILDYDTRSTSGYLDIDLIPTTASKLILLYRKNAGQDWTEYPYYTKNTNSINPPAGFVTISKLQLGEYAFATGISHIGIENTALNTTNFTIYPNPANNYFWIENSSSNDLYTFEIYDCNGKLIQNGSFNNKLKVETKNWAIGTYIVNVFNKEKNIYTNKIIVRE